MGLMLLSLPGYLPLDSAGRYRKCQYRWLTEIDTLASGYKWHQESKFPWASVAFLYCLQMTTAATFRDAFLRTVGRSDWTETER